jgi:cell division protein FtsQ
VAKTDEKSGPLTSRSSSSPNGGASILAENEAFDASEGGAFYRPSTRKASTDRPIRGDFPFRNNQPRSEPVDEDDEPFLRSSRRVAVRRGFIPRSRWGRIGFSAGALVLIVGLVWLGMVVHDFAAHDPRFRIDSSDNIQIVGNSEVTKTELLSVFGGDMGRNVFFVPLKERRGDLEQLPWVERATVMRLLPDQLRVAVVERTPVAFVRTGNEIGLVDHDGVLLPMAATTLAAKHYSFPVVSGIAASDPLSTRAARMKIYQRFVSDLDSSGEKLSSQLSEIDLSDPEDIRALVPSDGSDLLLHFGDQDFLSRWRNYQQHLAEWKQQYPRLASIDLRYERQVVLEMQKGVTVAPGQDAAGKTMEELKADAHSISTPVKRPAAGGRKAATKRTARPDTIQQDRN